MDSSTSARRRLRAWSHWADTSSRHWRAVSSGSGSSVQIRSLPSVWLRAMPAWASTWRCLVTAWRVMPPPAVRRAIESGPSALSRVTRRRRVSSPSAAKTGAISPGPPRNRGGGVRISRGGSGAGGADMALDGDHLLRPAVVVAPVRGRPAIRRERVEARLDNGQARPAVHLLQLEDDQRGRLPGVVDGLDAVGVPAPREEPLRLHALDLDLERQVLVAGVGDPALDARPGCERPLDGDAEPGTELPRVGQRLPDPCPRGAELDVLLDAVGGRGAQNMQPPGCDATRRWGRDATVWLPRCPGAAAAGRAAGRPARRGRPAADAARRSDRRRAAARTRPGRPAA